MHCPNCGTPAPADQKFCRACGISLQLVAQVLADELAAAQSNKSLVEVVKTTERQKNFEHWGKIISLSGMAMLMLLVGSLFVFIGLNKVFGVSFDLLNLIGPVMMAIAIPLLFVGVGVMVYPRLAKELSGLKSPQPLAEATTKLPPARHSESRHSVIEPTTELLETSPTKTSESSQRSLGEQMGREQTVKADTTNQLRS